MGLKDQQHPPSPQPNSSSRPPSRPTTPKIITTSSNRPGLKSQSTTNLPTMSAAVASSSSTLGMPHDRSRSDNLGFNTLSRTPTPISSSREFTMEPSPHHPDLSAEVATLSTKLINAINHNTDLDDSLQNTKGEVEAARQELQRINQQLEKERNQKLHAERERRKVEGELESLTSSLFEEANSMVASARRELQESESRNEQLKGKLRDAETLLSSHQQQLRELKEVLQQMQIDRTSGEPSAQTSAPGTPDTAASRTLSHNLDPVESSNTRSLPEHVEPSNPLHSSHLLNPVLRQDIQAFEEFVLMLEAGQKTAPSSRTNSGQFAGLNVMNIGSLSNLKQSTIIKSQLNQSNSSLKSSSPNAQNSSGLFGTNSPTDMSASPTIASSLKDQKYYKRAFLEDIEPTLRLDAAPGLSYFTRRNIVSSMASGNLVVEPFGPGQRYWSASFSCALCGEQREGEPYIRRHRFRTSDSDDAQRYQVCDYCLTRLRATGDYVNFMRMIRSGYWKNDNPDDAKVAWEECTKLRERMFWARIGGGVVPSMANNETTNGARVTSSPQKSGDSVSDNPLPDIEEKAPTSAISPTTQDPVMSSVEALPTETKAEVNTQKTPALRSTSPVRPSPTGSPSPAVRRPLSGVTSVAGPNKFLAARSRFESSEGSTTPERKERRPSSPRKSPERVQTLLVGERRNSRPTSSGADEVPPSPAEAQESPITGKLPGSFV